MLSNFKTLTGSCKQIINKMYDGVQFIWDIVKFLSNNKSDHELYAIPTPLFVNCIVCLKNCNKNKMHPVLRAQENVHLRDIKVARTSILDNLMPSPKCPQAQESINRAMLFSTRTKKRVSLWRAQALKSSIYYSLNHLENIK